MYFPFDPAGRRQERQPPSSPLITLLASLSPRERQSILSVDLGPRLGYLCARRFHNAEQVYRWLVPVTGESFSPSERMQDKRFRQVLTIEDLARSARVPPAVVGAWAARHRHRHLRGTRD